MIPQSGSEESWHVSNNALWDLPRDSLSILQYHLLRPRLKYSTLSGQAYNTEQWYQSRLRALHQLDIISSYMAALGNALRALFLHKPNILTKLAMPKSRIFGTLRADERVQFIRSISTVGYLITNRREASIEAIQCARKLLGVNPLFSKILKGSKMLRWEGKMLRWQWMEAMRGRTNLVASHPIPLLPAMEISNVFPLDGGMSMIALTDMILAFELQGIMVAARDNWIYLYFKDLVFAFQVFRKTKSTRKGLRKPKLKKASLAKPTQR